jgi:hypothetical protein
MEALIFTNLVGHDIVDLHVMWEKMTWEEWQNPFLGM